MADSQEPVIQTCSACGSLIDVSDEEPFALMHCSACGAAQRVRRTFDHFELQEVLGSGGMGAVYRALDLNLNRAVALKLLRKEYSTDEDFVRQFEKEAAITASINHPNVVKVYTAGQDHGLVYIVMELVDKGSLDDLMGLQGRVAEVQALEVGAQIAQGLNAALQRGLIHRDVKPGNILFAGAHSAKIVDFGLAVLQEHASTVAGEVWGTPYYVAPEKLDNQPEDFRSDLYSLGATLFHAIAGRPPFEAETASMVALKHLKSQAVSLQAFAPDVSSATAYVINKSLAKEPDERYQSYEEFIEHLDYARNELLEAAAKGPPQKSRVVLEGDATAKAMSWITFGMIALVVLGGVLLYLNRAAFSKSEPQIDPTIAAARKASAGLEPGFKAARDQLIAGNYAEGATALDQLAENPGIPQPLLNWITMHQGLARMLAGKLAEARPFFSQLEERGVYSSDPAEAKIANFFTETARQASSPSVIPAAVARNYDKSNFEAFALFILAVKDWQLGKFEEAGPLFRQFHSASPGAPYTWITEYRELTTKFLSTYTEFRSASELLGNATTDEEKKQAILEARAGLDRLQGDAKAHEVLEALIKEDEAKLAATAAEQALKASMDQQSDEKKLAQLRPQVAALFKQFKFAEAQAAASAGSFVSPAGQREQAALVKRAEGLAKFKSLLIADLNAGGYPQPVTRKNGQPIPGTASRASDASIEVRTAYGGVVIPWTDFPLETLFNMGKYFNRPGLASDLAADRQWTTGLFAFLAGKDREGRELLVEAAKVRPQYSEDLSLLLESAAPQ